MQFASDNEGPVHPKVMAALMAANEGYSPSYGADDLAAQVQDSIREIFEAPQATVFQVATGTAANALILATMAQPWQTVFCGTRAHIHEDECGAPEFFTGGSKLTLVPETEGRMTPEALRAAILGEETRGVHGPQRGPVSITQATESGTIHDLEQLTALTDVAQDFDLPVHMDGARFANALVRLGCSPAEMTWKAGVDAVSFGGTKNGLMGVETVVLFNPDQAWEFELRRKRGAHLFSKHRYLSAQVSAYLNDGLWLDMARAANTASDRLIAGLLETGHVTLAYPAQVNMIFAKWPRRIHRALYAAGARYHLSGDALEGDDPDALLTARLVCDWSSSPEATDQFLEVFRKAAG